MPDNNNTINISQRIIISQRNGKTPSNRDDHVIGDASGDNRIEHIEHGINDESDFSLQMFTLGINSNNNKNNGGLNIMEYEKHDHEFYDGHDASSQVPRMYMPVTSNVHHPHKKTGSGVQSATMAMTMSSSKRKRGSRGSCKNVQERENQRMTHIVVERNRRRQMNEHLRILRALMPPSYVQRVGSFLLTYLLIYEKKPRVQ